MRGFVSQWNAENQTGQIRACPQNQFYALIGDDNPAVAAVLNSLYPNSYSTPAGCPAPVDDVQVTFDPGPDETAQNVAIVSQPVLNPLQLAKTASMHALQATRHASALEALPGTDASVLQAAQVNATSAHAAAASAIAAAIQQQANSQARKAAASPKTKPKRGR
jgi:hypothetical protein